MNLPLHKLNDTLNDNNGEGEDVKITTTEATAAATAATAPTANRPRRNTTTAAPSDFTRKFDIRISAELPLAALVHRRSRSIEISQLSTVAAAAATATGGSGSGSLSVASSATSSVASSLSPRSFLDSPRDGYSPQVSPRRSPRHSVNVSSHELSRVLDRVYIGDLRMARDKDVLKQHHITHIVNGYLRTQEAFFQNDFEYCFADTDEGGLLEDLAAQLPRIVRWIDAALDSHPSATVLVYCYRGISASAAIVCGYYMAKHRVSFTEALEFVSKARPCVLPNPVYMQQLEVYQRSLGIGSTQQY